MLQVLAGEAGATALEAAELYGQEPPSALSTARNLSPAARSLMLQGLAEAFAHTFVWGFVVLVLAMVAAFSCREKGLTRLRRRRNGLIGTTRQVQRIIR